MAVENLNDAQQFVGLIQRMAADMGSVKAQNHLEQVNQIFELIRSGLLDNPINTKSIVMEQSDGYELVGSPEIFTSVDFGTEVDIIIPGILEITRDDNKGLYNVAQEVSFDQSGYTSPIGTEWNSIYTDNTLNGWSDLSNLGERTYDTWSNAHGFDPVGSIGWEQVMRETITGRYFKIKLLSWTSGGAGGGFSYERQEIKITPVATITFPDGSTMSTAPSAGVDTDSWKVPGTIFIDPANGDDLTGVVGDGNKPYRSFSAIRTLPETYVICLPGTYSGNQWLGNKHYHFMPGAVLGAFAKFNDQGQTVDSVFTGNLIFGQNSRGIEFLGANSKIKVECEEFDDVQSIAFLLGSNGFCHIKTKRILANGFNGAGYACSPRSNSKIVIEASEYCHWQHWLCRPISGGKFKVMSPEMRTLANYTSNFGNIAKAIFNIQGDNECELEADLMGGFYSYDHPVPVSSFGIAETALMLWVNGNTGTGSKLTFKNGTIYANVQHGLGHYYRVDRGILTLDNLKVKSDLSAIYQRMQSAVSADQVIWDITNCEFESGTFNVLGNGAKMYFKKSTFKNTGIAGTSVFDFNNSNPQVPGEFYFTGCYGQLDNTGNELISNGVATTVVGFLDSHFSEALETVAVMTDVYGGYSQVAALTLPNIK